VARAGRLLSDVPIVRDQEPRRGEPNAGNVSRLRSISAGILGNHSFYMV